MSGAQPYHWGPQHDGNSMCFDLGIDSMEHNRRELQQQQQVSEGVESRLPPHLPMYQNLHHLASNIPCLPKGDQVVPSFQRLTVYEHGQPYIPCRDPKPLPPLPDPEDLSSDEATDGEVEFFTDERRHLLPKSCLKSFALRHGGPGRRSFRGCGQTNYAYHEDQVVDGSSGANYATSSWANNRAKSVVTIETSGGTSSSPKVGTSNGGSFGIQGQWSQIQKGEQGMAAARVVPLGKQPDRTQRAKLRRSHSERRLVSHHHHHAHGNCRDNTQDKPEVPPRVPIPQLPLKSTTTDSSTDYHDKDKPPKVPPRVPLQPSVPPRTPSPKSLPIYVNGVMPPTQSFAPNPKYVSKAPQRLPLQSEEASSADMQSPCIVPIMEGGTKSSATHYFLLPRRPAYMDRLERFLKEADSESAGGACCSEWGSRMSISTLYR
ncbi:LOW QUALITY PROTEIN: ERBB receptor feedback inhibitor 1-like [Osmerus mordax]|uniref:LOW QUALITY PROTEIN: ERBB receptor feedback inhibitor 1-like n=1 Tax=Osmerus mordax TaxID=8014 RepID=UPI0035100705